jgi:hypothetical protein
MTCDPFLPVCSPYHCRDEWGRRKWRFNGDSDTRRGNYTPGGPQKLRADHGSPTDSEEYLFWDNQEFMKQIGLGK